MKKTSVLLFAFLLAGCAARRTAAVPAATPKPPVTADTPITPDELINSVYQAYTCGGIDIGIRVQESRHQDEKAAQLKELDEQAGCPAVRKLLSIRKELEQEKSRQ